MQKNMFFFIMFVKKMKSAPFIPPCSSSDCVLGILLIRISFHGHCGPTDSEMVSDRISAALEKAANRAARVAEGDAGLQDYPAPHHPSQKKSEALEKAKESSRRVS